MKKTSKRVLAVFLTVIMVITALPFAALAADTPDFQARVKNAQPLLDKMNAFEAGIADGKVHSNGANAYASYMKAKKAYDAYVYGENTAADISAGSYNFDLGEVINYDKVYDERARWMKGNIAGFGDEGLDTGVTLDNHSTNIIWSQVVRAKGDTLHRINGGEKEDDYFVNVYYGINVLAYDGKATPSFPVMATSQRAENEGAIYRLFPIDPNGPMPNSGWYDSNSMQTVTPHSHFKLGNLYRGQYWSNGVGNSNTPNADTDFCWSYAIQQNPSENIAGNGTDSYGNWRPGSGKAWPMIANAIQFDNASSVFPENSHFYQTNLAWGIYLKYYNKGGLFGIGAKDQYSTRTGNVTTPIYVLNVKEYNDAMANGVAKVNNIGSRLESEEQVKGLLLNLANYGNTDFKTFGTDAAYDISSANNRITDTINSVQNYSVGNIDSGSYPALKETIKAGIGTNTEYTTSSWANYEKAFNNAKAHFATVSNLYNGAEAGKLNKAIADAKDALVKRADFTAYNTAKAKLNDANNKYDYEKLSELNLDFDRYSLDTEAQKDIADNEQSSIDAEAAKMNSLKEFDTSAYEKALNDVRIGIDNTDKYDATELEEVFKTIEENYLIRKATVSAKGDSKVEITGYDYDSATTKLLTALNEAQFDYDVKIVNADGTETTVATGKHYGDTVDVPQGNYMMTVTAATTGITQNPYYVTGGKMAVRGDMVLTSIAKPGSDSCTVSFTSNDGVVLNAVGVAKNGELKLEEKLVPHTSDVEVSSFIVNGETKQLGDTITVTENTTIEVKFNVVGRTGVIKLIVNGSELTKKYNDKVILEAKDGEVFVNENGDVLCTAKEYIFYITENTVVNTIAKTVDIDKDTVVTAVNAPVWDEATRTAKLIGTFAEVEGYEVVTFGFVGGIDAQSVTLKEVNNKNICNFSVTSTTNPKNKQFVFNVIGYPTDTDTLSYTAYAIYKNTKTGDEIIRYSSFHNNVKLYGPEA